MPIASSRHADFQNSEAVEGTRSLTLATHTMKLHLRENDPAKRCCGPASLLGTFREVPYGEPLVQEISGPGPIKQLHRAGKSVQQFARASFPLGRRASGKSNKSVLN